MKRRWRGVPEYRFVEPASRNATVHPLLGIISLGQIWGKLFGITGKKRVFLTNIVIL
jgi:hypothetical protein